MKIFLIVAAVVVVTLIIAQLVLAGQFRSRIRDLDQRLARSQEEGKNAASDPPAVIRDFAIRNGARIGGPRVMKIVQAAEMRLAPDQPFFALAASQLSGTRVPGFVWQATGTMAAVVPLQVLDSYVDGIGLLDVRVAGSIPVTRSSDGETAKGEAMRFLAELPWNPEAILNSEGLTWGELEGGSVEVSMDTAGGVALVTLHIEAGDIVAIEAADRPRADDAPARWIGRFSDYVQDGVYRFPRRGEIAWDLPGGEFVYWRGEILSVTSETPL
jgi:hypothetical protein